MVMSARQTAEALGVNHKTVLDLIRVMGIKPGRHPSNAKAFGLTSEQVKAIKARLRPAPAEVNRCSA